GLRSDLTVFFFQAEDGIRDGHVTGVQTCALPISGRAEVGCGGLRIAGVLALAVVEGRAAARVDPGDPGEVADAGVAGDGFGAPRSEERRVGKGCRARRARGADIREERVGGVGRL